MIRCSPLGKLAAGCSLTSEQVCRRENVTCDFAASKSGEVCTHHAAWSADKAVRRGKVSRFSRSRRTFILTDARMEALSRF